jgi:hypothetical protein
VRNQQTPIDAPQVLESPKAQSAYCKKDAVRLIIQPHGKVVAFSEVAIRVIGANGRQSLRPLCDSRINASM